MAGHIFNKALKVLLSTNALIFIAGAMLAPIYALFVDEIGGDLLDASMTGGIFALAAGITTLAAGKYADKVKESELIVVLGYLIIAIAYVLFIFVDSIFMLFLVQIFMGIGSAIYAPAFDALYSKHLDKRRAGTQWGAWESMAYFTTAAGAGIGGLIVNRFGFDTLFIIMALLAFISAMYIYFLPRKVL